MEKDAIWDGFDRGVSFGLGMAHKDRQNARVRNRRIHLAHAAIYAVLLIGIVTTIHFS